MGLKKFARFLNVLFIARYNSQRNKIMNIIWRMNLSKYWGSPFTI